MTDYLILAVSEDTFTNDANEKYACRYIVAKRSDNVKPLVFKCTESAFNDSAKLTGIHCNFSFDEKGRVNGVAAIKS